MDELLTKMQVMLGHAFEQGMAQQRMNDAIDAFNKAAVEVSELFTDIRSQLEPEEGEQVQ